MRVVVLGVTGMLGHALFRVLAANPQHEVWGTLRGVEGKRGFDTAHHDHLVAGVDVLNGDALVDVLTRVRPDVVVNAVGVIKQLPAVNDPRVALPLNSVFPHRLAGLCGLAGIRLIQLSTDCVFSGRVGGYRESNPSDAEDLYGKSKYLGELHGHAHAITLRTSGIGHELQSANGLVGWFLSQQGTVKGYAKAIYSGLPSVELARVIDTVVLPRRDLHGLYHVSSKPIDKYALLTLIAEAYQKDIRIERDDTLVIDRSLDSARFTQATGYVAPEWPELVAAMHQWQ